MKECATPAPWNAVSNIIKASSDLFGNIEWKDGEKIRKVITEEILARVAQDKACQNPPANFNKQNAGQSPLRVTCTASSSA